MTQIRKPAVAGHFYPADAGELQVLVQQMLEKAQVLPGLAAKALIVPHAAYVYSGPVAAQAYAQLSRWRKRYRRVVLLGPCHRVALKGMAASGASAFRTPLGDVPLDQESISRFDPSAVRLSDAAHLAEHSLEVQLPFLQLALDSFLLVPLVVGNAPPQAIADVISALWGSADTLLVVSTDLSHYLPFDEALQKDNTTCQAIERMDFGRITHEDACGATPLAGLLMAAQRRGLHITTLDLRNSGQTAGGRGRVVGYGSWIIQEDSSCEQVA